MAQRRSAQSAWPLEPGFLRKQPERPSPEPRRSSSCPFGTAAAPRSTRTVVRRTVRRLESADPGMSPVSRKDLRERNHRSRRHRSAPEAAAAGHPARDDGRTHAAATAWRDAARPSCSRSRPSWTSPAPRMRKGDLVAAIKARQVGGPAPRLSLPTPAATSMTATARPRRVHRGRGARPRPASAGRLAAAERLAAQGAATADGGMPATTDGLRQHRSTAAAEAAPPARPVGRRQPPRSAVAPRSTRRRGRCPRAAGRGRPLLPPPSDRGEATPRRSRQRRARGGRARPRRRHDRAPNGDGGHSDRDAAREEATTGAPPARAAGATAVARTVPGRTARSATAAPTATAATAAPAATTATTAAVARTTATTVATPTAGTATPPTRTTTTSRAAAAAGVAATATATAAAATAQGGGGTASTRASRRQRGRRPAARRRHPRHPRQLRVRPHLGLPDRAERRLRLAVAGPPHGLRRGDAITGAVRQPREGERRTSTTRWSALDTVNGLDPEQAPQPPRVHQAHAALPAGAAAAGDRAARAHHPRHRPGHADRQGPARADRSPAEGRQDDGAAGASPTRSPRTTPSAT